MAPGQNHRVDLSGQGEGLVIADAIAVQGADAPGSVATWQPPISQAGDYGLYLNWPENGDQDPAATYQLYHGRTIWRD